MPWYTVPLPAAACLLFAAACADAPAPPGPASKTPRAVAIATAAPDAPGHASVGEQLLIDKGCGGCHTVAGVPGAAGVAGPNLTNVVLRPTLAGDQIPMSPQTMQQWLLDPRSLKPDTAMPSVGLSPQEAQDLTAFLFSEPYNPVQ